MLIDKLLSHIAPHDCLNCSAEGALLCADCTHLLTPVPAACYRCRRLSDTAKTCDSCRNHSELFAVKVATRYHGLAKDLVWQLKFQGAQAAAREIAEQLVGSLPQLEGFVIVPVATATSRIRQRGYDQATLIARALAARTGLPYVAALRRSGQHHQLGSGRQQRLSQLQEAYRVVRPLALKDQHVILIDDVLTTGATLEAAAKAIKAAGAKRVSGLVFARA
jgi:ComF family protein